MREDTQVKEFAVKAPDAGDGAPVRERGMADAFDAATLHDTDVVDVDQYMDTVKRKTPLEPEKHLLLAILEDALACYQKNLFARTAKKQAACRDAEAWIFAADDERFMSFETVCGVLGIEPSYLRRRLAEWQRGKVKARVHAPAQAA